MLALKSLHNRLSVGSQAGNLLTVTETNRKFRQRHLRDHAAAAAVHALGKKGSHPNCLEAKRTWYVLVIWFCQKKTQPLKPSKISI